MAAPSKMLPSPFQVLLERLSSGLDALDVGLLLCAGDGAPRFLSERAGELLGGAGRDGLRREIARLARAAVEQSPRGLHRPALHRLVDGAGFEVAAAVVLVPEGALVFVRAVRLGRDGEEFAEAYGLTTAERAIARLLAKRLTNKEIAAELGVSPHTVKHHVERILHKLGISSRKEVRGVLRDGRQ